MTARIAYQAAIFLLAFTDEARAAGTAAPDWSRIGAVLGIIWAVIVVLLVLLVLARMNDRP